MIIMIIIEIFIIFYNYVLAVDNHSYNIVFPRLSLAVLEKCEQVLKKMNLKPPVSNNYSL